MRALDSQVIRWHISTASTGGEGCVEGGYDPDRGLFVVRHSKRRAGTALIFTPQEWDAVCADPDGAFLKVGPDAFDLRHGGEGILFNRGELDAFKIGVARGEFTALSLSA